jgi:hypothetical protein
LNHTESQARVRRQAAPFAAALAGVLALASAPAARAEITVDLSTGKGLANLAVDPLWSVTSSYFNGGTVGTKVLDAPGFPFGPWIANTADSKWITPNDPAFTQANAPPASGPPLSFVYSTTFNLTAQEAPTAKITGLGANAARWTSDNDGLQVLLNGVLVSNSNTGSTAFTSWHDLADITSGFQAGANTLEFVVRNRTQASGNPTGFRFEGQLAYAAIPEPSSIALAGLGLASLGVAARRRKARPQA